ncbi:MAG: polysaccharide biosynthesis/export family protein [Saprospiraceae bacterium]
MYKQLLYSLLICMSLSSCVTHQQLILFSDGEEPFSYIPEDLDNLTRPVIQTDDILFISLEGDPAAIASYTKGGSGSNMMMGGIGQQNPGLFGYLVNTRGEIQYPGLGTLKIGGMSTEELEAMLYQRLDQYLNNYVVTVRLLNFRVTVLGDVAIQGPIQVNNERITIVEAIGQAGGLTPYGNASDILLIREQNGERQYHQINLHDKDIFKSPLFYLKQNDVIYVRPLSQKTATIANQSRNIVPWIGIIASTLNLYFLITRL